MLLLSLHFLLFFFCFISVASFPPLSLILSYHNSYSLPFAHLFPHISPTDLLSLITPFLFFSLVSIHNIIKLRLTFTRNKFEIFVINIHSETQELYFHLTFFARLYLKCTFNININLYIMESLKCNRIYCLLSIYTVYLFSHFVLSGQENVLTPVGGFSNFLKKMYSIETFYI